MYLLCSVIKMIEEEIEKERERVCATDSKKIKKEENLKSHFYRFMHPICERHVYICNIKRDA